jgi:hypothetical protein
MENRGMPNVQKHLPLAYVSYLHVLLHFLSRGIDSKICRGSNSNATQRFSTLLNDFSEYNYFI